MEKSKAAREEADVFLQKNVSPKAVCEAGRKIFVMLYGGKNSDSLTYLRYKKYMKMSSAANVIPESLPQQNKLLCFIYTGYNFNSMNGTHLSKVLWTQKIGGGD